MKTRALASNGTNSAAISDKGIIYVWGLKRFGLIPDEGKSNKLKQNGNTQGKNGDNEMKNQYQSTPKAIKLDLEGQSIVGEESIDFKQYWATSISFGSHHAMAILNDRDTKGDFAPIPTAKKLIEKMKEIIKKYFVEEREQPEDTFEMSRVNIDKYFEIVFKDDFPLVTQSDFEK